MRTLFAIYEQKVPVFIKYTDTILETYDLKFGLVYRAFDLSDFKQAWSRHLDDFTHSMFCSASDLIKLNIFNPYKKIIKLNDLKGSYVAYHIINSFASQRQEYFDDIVFCCYVHGLEEAFVMAPEISNTALNIALTMRKSEDEEAKKDWLKDYQNKKKQEKRKKELKNKGLRRGN